MKVLEEIRIPQMDSNTEVFTILSICFNDNDSINAGDMLLELESSKSVITIEAENSGYVHYLCKEGDELSAGTIIVEIYDEKCVPDNKQDKKSIPIRESETGREPVFSKSALQLIKEKNIDMNLFKNEDFVDTKRLQLLLAGKTGEKAPHQHGNVHDDEEKPHTTKDVTIEKLSTQKKIQIRYLSDVQSGMLTSTVSIFINTRNLFESLPVLNPMFKNSILPVLVYETGKLLKKHKEFNAYFTHNAIAYYNAVHIGIGIDLGDGLKVLTIRDTDQRDVSEIEETLYELTMKYLERTIEPSDLSDSTFTITDLSGAFISSFIPLINKNQSAILGISSVDEQLQRCTVSLTFDHRVTNGRNAGIFLYNIKKGIESYVT